MHLGNDLGGPGGPNGDFASLLGFLMGGPVPGQGQRRAAPGGEGSGIRFEMRTGGSGGGNTRTFVLGNPPQFENHNHDHLGGIGRTPQPPPLGA